MSPRFAAACAWGVLLPWLAGCMSEGDVLVAGAGGTAPGGPATGAADGAGADGSGADGAGAESSGGAASTDQILLAVDFEQSDTGPYEFADIAKDWGPIAWADEGFVEVVADARGRYLRAHYPEGSVGPKEGGGQWQADLGGVHQAVTARYKLRFGPGFEWVQGGMLPGLAGGTANTAENVPTGTDGWTARAGWRPEGGAHQYVYHPDQAGSFGDRWVWNAPPLQSDRWYQVTQRIVMNTPSEHDAVVQTWLDDTLVLDRRDVRFRDTDSLGIDLFYFSTFFGGGSDAFRAEGDETIDFDDFLITVE